MKIRDTRTNAIYEVPDGSLIPFYCEECKGGAEAPKAEKEAAPAETPVAEETSATEPTTKKAPAKKGKK